MTALARDCPSFLVVIGKGVGRDVRSIAEEESFVSPSGDLPVPPLRLSDAPARRWAQRVLGGQVGSVRVGVLDLGPGHGYRGRRCCRVPLNRRSVPRVRPLRQLAIVEPWSLGPWTVGSASGVEVRVMARRFRSGSPSRGCACSWVRMLTSLESGVSAASWRAIEFS